MSKANPATCITPKHEPAHKGHQEVITPPALIDHIVDTTKNYFIYYDKLRVLDPCVGPGAMLDIPRRYAPKVDITTLDIQSRYCNPPVDFLAAPLQSFKPYDLVVMNPPWVKLGIQFHDKAIQLLKPQGYLISVMGYNQFTPHKDKPGSFYRMQKEGHFHIIDCYKGGTKRDYFKQHEKERGDWLWFLWQKH